MALYEKKNILRGMYAKPDPQPTDDPASSQAAAIAAANGIPSKFPTLDSRIEKILFPVLRTSAFLPFLLGLLALAWPLVTHYLEARAFREMSSPERYFKEAFITIGAIVFVILLGLLAFVGLRDHLHKTLRWTLLALTLALIPLAFISMFFGPLARSLGTQAGYNAIDGSQLLLATNELYTAYPVANWDVRTITPLDPEWPTLPTYIKDSVKPQRVNIYARGITLDLEVNPYGYSSHHHATTTPSTPRSGLAILRQSPGQLPYNNPDLDRFASKHGYTRSPTHDGTTTGVQPGGLRPILRYADRPDEFEELREGSPPPPPPTTPGSPTPPGTTGTTGTTTETEAPKNCTCEG